MNKLYSLALLAVGAVTVFTGCKKFVDVNQNPNSFTQSRADYILTGALATTYRLQVGTNNMIIPGTWTGVYAHSTSFTGGGNDKTYEFTPADYDVYTGLYDNLYDYQYIIDSARNQVFNGQNLGYLADIANVMQCYGFQQLVDVYGNVPYTQALRGINEISAPFDNQQTIYEDLVVRLDSAMDRMQRTVWPTLPDFTIQDPYFALNKTSWIQFANSVKLRILMRQSFMGGARDTYIQQKVATKLANGFIQNNVICNPGYAVIGGKLNPFYANHGYNENGVATGNYSYRKMNAVVVNFLKNAGGAADTFRLERLAYPIGATFNNATTTNTSITGTGAAVTSYVGVPLGAGSGFATASSSPIGQFVVKFPEGARPGMVMLLSELRFMQAEYTERFGGTPFGASAADLFNQGILFHYRTLAAPGTAIAVTTVPGTAAADQAALRYYNRTGTVTIPAPTPYTTSLVNYGLSTNKIQTILVQKWLSQTHINGMDQWADYRKSNTTTLPQPWVTANVPANVRTSAATTNPEPVRFLYPQTVQDANTANVPAVDRFTSKIFWDVN